MKGRNRGIKKCLAALIGISMMLGAIGAIPASAVTTWYFYQDFDHQAAATTSGTFSNNESGQPEGGTNAAWTLNGGASGSIQVVDDTTGGNKYIGITTDASTNYVVSFASAAPQASVMVLECKVKTLTSGDSGRAYLILNPSSGSSYNIMYLQISKNSIINGGNSTNLITGLTPDTWYYLRATIDLSSNAYTNITLTCGTAYNNPTQSAKFAASYQSATGAVALKITPKGSGLTTKTMYIDDLKAYSIPVAKSNMLSDIQIDTASSAVFDPAATTYSTTTAMVSPAVRLRPVVYDTNAAITVNGEAVASGAWSNPVDISLGATAGIPVTVTPPTGSGLPSVAYTVNITRPDHMVIDYGDTGYSEAAGGWYSSSGLKGYNNSDTRYSFTTSPLPKILWSPNAVTTRVSGLVEVYFWKALYNDGIDDAWVKVVHKGKTEEYHLNLQGDPSASKYMYLGTFDFAGTSDEGVSVERAASATGSCMRVDSVKFAVPEFGAASPVYLKVEGETETDITSTGLAAGEIKGQVKLVSNAGGKSFSVIMALYNTGANTLEKVRILDGSLTGNQTGTFTTDTITVPAAYQDYEIRFFVWDGVNRMQPLTSFAAFH